MSKNTQEKVKFEFRLGRFRIRRKYAEDWKRMAQMLGDRFFIVRCELTYESDSFEYTAFSSLFDVIEEGFEAPFYQIAWVKEEGEVPSIMRVERWVKP